MLQLYILSIFIDSPEILFVVDFCVLPILQRINEEVSLSGLLNSFTW